MKQNSLKYQFTALLAALYFVVAGIGHNVVDYCCDSCETVGIEFIANHSCSEAHHAEPADCTTKHAKESCCSLDHQSDVGVDGCPVEGKCELTRFQLDTFYSLTSAIQLQVPVLDLDDLAISYLRLSAWSCQTEKNQYYPPPELNLQSGRSILAHKSVLVI